MKYVIVYSASLVVLFYSCHKKLKPKTTSGIPACIEAQISSNKNNPEWEVGLIEEYRFHDKTVYALKPDMNIIADGATTVQAADCSVLCTVGGFGGEAINFCDGGNFFQEARLVKKIWEKQEPKPR